MEGGVNPTGVEDGSINSEEVEEEEEEEDEAEAEVEVEVVVVVEAGKLPVEAGMMEMISVLILVPVGHSSLPHLEVQEVDMSVGLVGLVEELAEEDLRDCQCPEDMMMRRRRDPDLDLSKCNYPCRRYT